MNIDTNRLAAALRVIAPKEPAMLLYLGSGDGLPQAVLGIPVLWSEAVMAYHDGDCPWVPLGDNVDMLTAGRFTRAWQDTEGTK